MYTHSKLSAKNKRNRIIIVIYYIYGCTNLEAFQITVIMFGNIFDTVVK